MATERIRLEAEGMRVDRALAEAMTDWTRSSLAPLFAEGRIRLDGRPLRPSERLPAGSVVSVDFEGRARAEEGALPEAQAIALDIRYEDEVLLVINKPQGLVVHPAPGHPDGTLVNAILHHVGSALHGVGAPERPGIIHRLDRDTSGLILVVKDAACHRRLARALARHEIVREYDAIVLGHVAEGGGRVEAPLGRDPRQRQRQAVRTDGRHAVTHFTVVRSLDHASLLRVRLETGRTHQIRVHMQYIGHPVVGDPLYSSPRQERAAGLPPLGELPSQLLHAGHLAFDHPLTGARIDLSCPWPAAFDGALAQLDVRARTP